MLAYQPDRTRYQSLADVEAAIIAQATPEEHTQADHMLVEALRLTYERSGYPQHIFSMTLGEYHSLQQRLGHRQADAYLLRELITMERRSWIPQGGTVRRILFKWYATVYDDACRDARVMLRRLIEMSTGNEAYWPAHFTRPLDMAAIRAETQTADTLLADLDALAQAGDWNKDQAQVAKACLDNLCKLIPSSIMPGLYHLVWLRKYWLDSLPAGEEAVTWLTCLTQNKLPGAYFRETYPALLESTRLPRLSFPDMIPVTRMMSIYRHETERH